MNDSADVFRIVVAILLILSIYFLPTGVAVARNRSNALAIFLVNFFFGIFLIGWLIALIWAATDDNRPRERARAEPLRRH